MKNIHKLYFILILLFATIFRFWQLGQIPYSLNWDEISHGYNAYSLLKTGKDQWGISWPIFNFRAYGDFPTTANLYLTMPFIKLFDLNSFSLRLPDAILGVIFVVLNYLFAKIIFKKEKLALFCMLLAAFSPWSLFPSRGVFQSNLSQTFLLLALYLFFKSLKKPALFILSLFSFGLSLYAYHNTRIVVLPIIITLIIFYFHKLKILFFKNKIICSVSIILFLILAVPNLTNLFSPSSLARNRWVGIINPNSINLINEQRRVFSGPMILNHAINNKVTFFIKTASINYLELINPIPIFWRGSQDYQFNPPHTGLIFLIFTPFFYYGLYLFIKKSYSDTNYFLLLVLFLITLLPAAITVGNFPSIRATIALPFYFIFISYGITTIKISRSNVFTSIILVIAAFQFISYWRTYLQYNLDYSQTWQYGYEQAISFAKQNYSQYHQIVFTKKYGEPHEFILFYWPWDPSKFQTDPTLKWDYHADWYWVDAFDKFKFVNDWEIKTQNIGPQTLLITSPNNYPLAKSRLIKTINFLNHSPAFDIVSYD